jgi:hypothetical protein
LQLAQLMINTDNSSQLFETPFVLTYNPGAIYAPGSCILSLGLDWQMPSQLKKALAGNCLWKDVSPANGRGYSNPTSNG